MQVAVHLKQVLPQLERLTLAVGAVAVSTTYQLTRLPMAVLVDASLGIGVKNGTFCKN
jgi:hypothetical protein